MPDAEGHWRLLPYVILRQTGFPFELLSRLRFEATVGAIERVLDTEADMEETRDEAVWEAEQQIHKLREGDFNPSVAVLQRCIRALRRDREVDADLLGVATPLGLAQRLRRWNELRQAKSDLLRQGEVLFRQELMEMRRTLHEIAQELPFQEALFLSSPGSYEAATRYAERPLSPARTQREREAEHLLVCYLQRLCAKNDTTSFFGPCY